jgi:hypothetical protein
MPFRNIWEPAIVVPIALVGGLIGVAATIATAPLWGPIIWFYAKRHKRRAEFKREIADQCFIEHLAVSSRNPNLDLATHAKDLLGSMKVRFDLDHGTLPGKVVATIRGVEWRATCDTESDAVLALAREAIRRYPERFERLGGVIN